MKKLWVMDDLREAVPLRRRHTLPFLNANFFFQALRSILEELKEYG